jgi:hypothetical protein
VRKNLRIALKRWTGVAQLTALAGCGGGGEDAPPPQPASPPPAGLQPTLASIQANVFTPSCAKSGCHTGIAPQAGLRLDPGFSWAALVNVASSQPPAPTRVIPMDPDGSFLIQKLEGTALVGGRMPADGPPYLQQATVDFIRQWILDGALP